MPESPPLTPSHPEVLPPQAAGLTVVDFDGEQVIYDPARREAHLLNPTAALVLGGCDGRTPLGLFAEDLATTFDADPDVVRHDVRLVLADFAERGLTASPAGPTAPAIPVAPHASVARESGHLSADAGRPTGSWVWESPVLDALGWCARVRTDEPLVARYVEQVFGSLFGRAAVPSDRSMIATFDVIAAERPVRLLLDGEDITAGDDLDSVMTYLHWQINQMAIAATTTHVLLHASAVRRSGGVAVFPAESNSGKSTLAAGLVQAGFGYVTDEAVAIGLDDGRVEPFPKPLSLDPGSWSLFPGLEPSIEGAEGRFFFHEWHLDPRALHPAALADLDADQRVDLVAFPRYEADAPTAAELLRPAEALLGLLRNAFNLATVGRPGVLALATIARDTPVVRMTVGRLDDAVALIRTLS